jgi:hypothetical protein
LILPVPFAFNTIFFDRIGDNAKSFAIARYIPTWVGIHYNAQKTRGDAMKMPSIGLEPDPPRSERDRTVMKKAAGPPVKIGRRPIFIVAVLALALAAWTISAEAQPPAATAKADAGALAALDKMGAYLRTLKEFQGGSHYHRGGGAGRRPENPVRRGGKLCR